MNRYHIPVLLKESIDLLSVEKGKWYVDATFGDGGHTKEILRRGGLVLALDIDEEAVLCGKKRFKKYIEKGVLILERGNFANVDIAVQKARVGGVAGVLYDLGVSLRQLENKKRGFSFDSNAALDMRMSKEFAVTALDLLNALDAGELAKILRGFGEEPDAKKIALEIVRSRDTASIKTGEELRTLVERVKGKHRSKANSATRTFQALRIAVNGEIENLETSLPRAFKVLEPKGRIVVISFHSLEDRIVKRFCESEGGLFPVTKGIVRPAESEVFENRKARSARMRILEKR